MIVSELKEAIVACEESHDRDLTSEDDEDVKDTLEREWLDALDKADEVMFPINKEQEALMASLVENTDDPSCFEEEEGGAVQELSSRQSPASPAKVSQSFSPGKNLISKS